MKYLGIDFGTKRVGLATSNEDGTLAFPKEVVANDANLIPHIANIVEDEDIATIVIGESRNEKGEANVLLEKSKAFAEHLQSAVSIPVAFEAEYMTTMHAQKTAEFGEVAREDTAQKGKLPKRDTLVDARAAALILQTYLDKQQTNNIHNS